MRHSFFSIGLTFCAGVLLLAPLACSDDDDDKKVPDVEPTGSVLINIEHMVGDSLLVFDEMKFTNAAGNNFKVETLEYYLSDIRFMGPDGTADLKGVHYVDGRDPGTHTITVADVPARHYHMVAFTFGLSEERNISNTLPDDGMEWPGTWGGGYHYMKLEGDFHDNAGGEDIAFLTHTGRYDVASEGRADEMHFFTATGTLHRSVVENQTFEITISMDLLEWYEDPNQIDLIDHNRIMMNFDKQVQLEQNGASVFDVKVN